MSKKIKIKELVTIRKFVLLSFLASQSILFAQEKPFVENIVSDSARINFRYPDAPNIKSVRLISELIPYFDNGTRITYDNTGWFKKHGDNWLLSVTVDNRLRIPYRFEVTVRNKEKDSTYEVLDPFNPNTYVPDNLQIRQSLVVLKNAFLFPWESPLDTLSKWKRVKINPGTSGGMKNIFVYTPPGYKSSYNKKYPLIIGLESFTFGIEIPTALIYESLLKSGTVKPALIALIDFKSYNSQANFDSLASYVTNDILPYMEKAFHVSTIASDITVSGTSRRGVAASYIALKNARRIGNVISLSGGFSWRPNSKSEFEWFAHILANNKRTKVKYYLSAGTLESVVTPSNAGHYILSVNRHVRDILIAKDYTFKYEELPGAHNATSWSHFLYNGMAYVLKKKEM